MNRSNYSTHKAIQFNMLDENYEPGPWSGSNFKESTKSKNHYRVWANNLKINQNSGQQRRFHKLIQVFFFFLRLPDTSETCLPTCTDMGNEAYYSNDREMESHQHIDHSDYLHLHHPEPSSVRTTSLWDSRRQVDGHISY